jgi:hypothetical protein
MTRHSRKRGGGQIEDIQTQLDSIQQQINEMKNPGSSSSSTTEIMEILPEPILKTKPVMKTWVLDKTDKFNDGNSGRVTLAFSRIITLLDNNIKKGDTKKDWMMIKQKLNDANSRDEVQDIIKEYKINFSSNYVAGTKRRRKNKGKKMSRKYK